MVCELDFVRECCAFSPTSHFLFQIFLSRSNILSFKKLTSPWWLVRGGWSTTQHDIVGACGPTTIPTLPPGPWPAYIQILSHGKEVQFEQFSNRHYCDW